MSWDPYIDNVVSQTGTQHCDRACIIGLDGSAWTTSGHPNALKLAPNEAATIAKCFKSKDFSSLQSSGIHAEGVKYQFLREEDGKLVMGKKKDHGALCMASSKQAIVIAHTPEGGQQGNTNKGVCFVSDYLEGMGY